MKSHKVGKWLVPIHPCHEEVLLWLELPSAQKHTQVLTLKSCSLRATLRIFTAAPVHLVLRTKLNLDSEV